MPRGPDRAHGFTERRGRSTSSPSAARLGAMHDSPVRRGLAGALLCLLVLAGCGGDDDPPPGASAPPAATTSAPTALPGPSAAARARERAERAQADRARAARADRTRRARAARERADRPDGSRAGVVTSADEAIVDRLSVAEQAGQRVIAPFRRTGATIPDVLRRAITAGRVGGVILFRENGTTRPAIRRVAAQLQAIERPDALADVPLLVMTDQEGGLVRRLDDTPPRPSAARQAWAGGATVRSAARRSAAALCRAGINVNLAPVVDVGTSRGFIDEQRRSYGRTAARAGRYAAAFTEDAQAAGVATTAKHFPGLGRARVNTDLAPSAVRANAAALRRRDVAAFQPVVDAGVELVMLANAIYPAFDDVPSVLSRRTIRRELRDRLGFRGLTISDDLEAGALRRGRTNSTLAVDAARAGVDVLLYGIRTETAITASGALAAAIGSRVPEGEARAATERVVALRRRLASDCR